MRAAPLSAALLPLALAACGPAPKPGPPQADTAAADDGAADGAADGTLTRRRGRRRRRRGRRRRWRRRHRRVAPRVAHRGGRRRRRHPQPLDCAPFDPTVAPGATEVCGDGVVNDCDRRAAGWSDELCAVQSEALIEIIKPTSYVAEAASLGDMMGDGGFYMGIGIPSATRCDVIGVDEWGADVYDCYRIGGFYMLELAALRPSSHGNELWLPRPDAPGVFGVDGHLRDRNYGSSLEGLGDLDGDGYADFIVGNDQPGRGAETDEVWLFWGPGLPDRFDEGTQLLLGDDPGRCIGYDMERAGDLTGDGVDDLVVGDPCRDEAWVWSGADVVAGVTGADLSPAARIVDSSAEAIELGMGLSGRSDLTGDGVADLVVSAPNARRTIGGPDLDYVGVYAGPFAGDRAAEDRAATVRTSLVMADYSEHALGCTVDVGDLNGDGYFDLVVGDPMWYDNLSGETTLGLTTVYFGPLAGDYVDSEAEVQLYRGNGEVEAHTDFDGDGRDDLLSGSGSYSREGSAAPWAFGTGRAHLMYAPLVGVVDLRSAADVLFEIPDDDPDNDQWGAQVLAVPDQTGDGVPDVVVGTVGDAFWLMATPPPR
jgi:hypothetical protein